MRICRLLLCVLAGPLGAEELDVEALIRRSFALYEENWNRARDYEFIERDWLHKYWEAGLPKHHPRMHYYLNTFPHAHGRGRPVGPESDPHSVLGLTKWLIQEIKMSSQ